MPETSLNSELYWNGRFEGDWEEKNGPHYTFSHAEVALENLPGWLTDDFRRNGLSLCDWGCAEGEAVCFFRNRFPENRISGVDFAENAIARAQERFPGGEFRCEDWLTQADVKRKYDIVFTSHTLEHFHDPDRILWEVLAPRAEKYLIFLVPFQEDPRNMDKEHFFRFLPGNIRLRYREWECVHYQVTNSRRNGDFWQGIQVLVVYARHEWLKKCNFELFLTEMQGESAWLVPALREAEQQIVLEREKCKIAEEKRQLQMEHGKIILSQNQWLTTQLDEQKKELERLQTSNQKLTEKIQADQKQFQGELDNLKRQNLSSLEEIEGWRKKMNHIDAELGKLREEGETLRAELDKSREEGETLRAELKRVRGEGETLRAELDKSREEGETLRAELGKSREEGETLRAELGKSREEGKTLRAELDKSREEGETLRAELDKSREEGETLRAELAKLRGEIEKVRDEQKKTAFAREQTQTELNGKNAEIARQKQTIAAKDLELKRFHVTQNLLNACRDELAEMKSARSYQLVCKINRLRLRLGLYPSRKAELPAAQPKVAAPRVETVVPAVPSAELRPLSRIRVGAIMDTFSFSSFAPECDLFSFRPDNWKQLFAEKKPDFLLVESAWNGNDGAWQYRVGTYSGVSRAELFELLEACRKQEIPSVFWNKEDPPHFDKFIEAARAFDYVFTTDENCIPLYREQCGHDRIFALPFAAQPRLHNPVLKTPRDRNVCFAGTYYANRFAERRQQMDILFNAARDLGLDIYDRMFGNSSPGYQNYLFPEDFRQFIRGRLEYKDMVEAYRRYKLFLNTNSVSDSRTMFSRRVFELLACGTAVVSTPSDGIRYFFGELVPEITDVEQGRAVMEKILHDEPFRRRHGAAGVRLVMSRHTYAKRLQEICSRIGLSVQEPGRESVAVVVRSARHPERLLENLTRQSLRPTCVLLPEGNKKAADKLRAAGWDARLLRNVAVVPEELQRIPGLSAAAIWDGEDCYMAEYLADAAMALNYSGAAVTGMTAVSEYAGNWRINGDLGRENFMTDNFFTGTLVFRPDFAGKGGWLPAAWQKNEIQLPEKGYARSGFEYAARIPADLPAEVLKEITL